MSERININPALGDAICTAIERSHGVAVDIVLMVAPIGDWSRPTFVTSLDPDVMEAVVAQLGEQMLESVGGKRVVTGTLRT